MNSTGNARDTRLLLLGLPASGKTTLAQYVSSELSSAYDVLHLSIDDVLRIQCPPGSASLGQEVLYNRDGFDFLLSDRWRPMQMSLAMRGLFILASVVADRLPAGTNGRILLLELPFSCLPELSQLDRAMLGESSRLLVLSASTDARRIRNANRAPTERLPPAVFDYFDKTVSNIDPQPHLDTLSQRGWRIGNENTDGDRDSVLPRLQRAVLNLLA